MIFNDELIIMLKMKTNSVTICLLSLFSGVICHMEYDETDPFKEYRNDLQNKHAKTEPLQ